MRMTRILAPARVTEPVAPLPFATEKSRPTGPWVELTVPLMWNERAELVALSASATTWVADFDASPLPLPLGDELPPQPAARSAAARTVATRKERTPRAYRDALSTSSARSFAT